MSNGENSYHRYIEGDEDAFREIWELYYKSLVFFINRYTNNIDTSEDVAADAFLELIIHKERYNFSVSLKTYLFSIAHHLAVNRVKKSQYNLPLSIEENEKLFSEEAELAEASIVKERNMKMHRAIAQLSDEQKKVVHL